MKEYTTTDIAKILQVTRQSVKWWIQKKFIKRHNDIIYPKIPTDTSTIHRISKITKKDFRTFMRNNARMTHKITKLKIKD